MQHLFTNARIIDATASEPRLGNVLVEDGIIRDLEAADRPGEDRRVIDRAVAR